MGGGNGTSWNASADMTNYYPVAIGGHIQNGSIGNLAGSQSSQAEGTGGSFGLNLSGLLELNGMVQHQHGRMPVRMQVPVMMKLI